MEKLNNIIRLCTQGNEAACKSLYEEFLPYGYGICKRYQISESNIKDQLQIIFSATFKSISNFDASKASFKTWFTRIAINKIIEEKRKYNRAPIQEEINDYDMSFSYSNQSELDDNLDRAYIMDILSKMPLKYQDVFNLSIVDGYSHKEISEMLGISIGSSRIILNRSREWAKNALASFLKHS